MFCSNCGNQVPDGTKTCPECGQDLSYESRKMARMPKNQKKKYRKKSKRSHHFLFVLILVALAGGVAFHYLKGPSGKVSSASLIPNGNGSEGGVTDLLAGEGSQSGSESAENPASDSEASSDESFLGGKEPTPTLTVTPIAQLPETKASIIPTPTPTDTPAATPSPATDPSASPSPAAQGTANPSQTPAPTASPAHQ